MLPTGQCAKQMAYKNIEEKREASKKWYRENKKRSIQLSTKWRKKNRERYLEGRRENYQLRKDELRKKARKYYQEVRKEKRKNNPEMKKKEAKWALKRIAKLKQLVQSLKIEMGGKCNQCGYSEQLKILQYHHLNKKQNKLGNISEMKSMKKIREEAKKCILLCPNCHALEHLSL